MNKRIKELEYLAYTDDLTQIFNRRKISEILREAISNKNPACIIMFDVDDFKKINDNFGHYRGDKVLQTLSKLVSQCLDDKCFFARWGGEEFVIVVKNKCDKSIKLAKRIRKLVEQNVFEEANQVTISIGVTEINKNDTLDSAIIRADNAIYKAKHGGKNRVEIEKCKTK